MNTKIIRVIVFVMQALARSVTGGTFLKRQGTSLDARVMFARTAFACLPGPISGSGMGEALPEECSLPLELAE
ncbi:hypothetical protein [Rhizobium leguminosarum]|uniref:hypothetical protein n=1 Tax=Rhizobium leguminosarum TaxID=384 RepID=UPI0010126F40|nr:hypothetical protein [Rhizobium leguminosarum]